MDKCISLFKEVTKIGGNEYLLLANQNISNTKIKAKNLVNGLFAPGTRINEISVEVSNTTGVPEASAEVVDNRAKFIFKNIKGEKGDSNTDATNLADNEDIQSVENETGVNVLKFADKVYNPLTFSGKGYKILRKQINDVLDYEKIKNVKNFHKEYTPDKDIHEETYEGEVNYVILDKTNKTVYGVVGVTENIWYIRNHYYKNWTGKTKFNREEYSTENGTPLNNVIYSTSYKRPYFVFENNSFKEYDTTRDAPKKQGCVLLEDSFQASNTVYVIKYDFNLNSKKLIVGENSTLLFIGGSLSDGELQFNQNTHIVNLGQTCIFNDVYFNMYSNLAIDNIFVDTWHNDIFAYNVIACVPKLILTKDYTINDNAHYSQEGCVSANEDTLIIEGNGHKIDIVGLELQIRGDFLRKKHIICNDLNITTGDVSSNGWVNNKVDVIFNCRSANFNNCKYYGHSRLIANWGFNETDTDNCVFKVNNCLFYTSSFLAEGLFDIIEINASIIELLEPYQYLRDILSVGPDRTEITKDNAYVTITNSKITGGIEFVAKEPNKNYDNITVSNCILKQFAQTYQSRKVNFDANCKVHIQNCLCYVGKGGGRYDAIDTILFSNCTFISDDTNVYGAGPFLLYGVNLIEFNACTFTTDSNSPKEGLPLIFINLFESDPFPNITDRIKIKIIDCNISKNFIGYNRIIDFTQDGLVINEQKLINNIHITGTTFVIEQDNKNNVVGILATKKKKYLLPISNFVHLFNLLELPDYSTLLLDNSKSFTKGYLINDLDTLDENRSLLPVIYDSSIKNYNNLMLTNVYSIGLI